MKKGFTKDIYKTMTIEQVECHNCGERYKETKKECPRCQTANLDYFQHFRDYKDLKD